ncbi:hypothetical protein AB1Y20_022799 [Prymnesium parvum]|uniref:Uncharacterized protein n=1 Tax=Prymnesium parvum TaxID=97485 RepID=A0AB34JB61_PRYPA
MRSAREVSFERMWAELEQLMHSRALEIAGRREPRDAELDAPRRAPADSPATRRRDGSERRRGAPPPPPPRGGAAARVGAAVAAYRESAELRAALCARVQSHLARRAAASPRDFVKENIAASGGTPRRARLPHHRPHSAAPRATAAAAAAAAAAACRGRTAEGGARGGGERGALRVEEAEGGERGALRVEEAEGGERGALRVEEAEGGERGALRVEEAEGGERGALRVEEAEGGERCALRVEEAGCDEWQTQGGGGSGAEDLVERGDSVEAPPLE